MQSNLYINNQVRSIIEYSQMENLISHYQDLCVKVDNNGQKIVVNKNTNNIADLRGAEFEGLMNYLTTLISQMENKSEWEICDWIPCNIKNPKDDNSFDYYMCTIEMEDGTLTVKPCWYGDGHWWYGTTQFDDYVKAWLPNKQPFKGINI